MPTTSRWYSKPSPPWDPLEIVAVYPAGKQPLPKTQAFIRFLAKRLPERLGC